MELFAKIVNGLKLLTSFVKSYILDVCQGSKYPSVFFSFNIQLFKKLLNFIQTIFFHDIKFWERVFKYSEIRWSFIFRFNPVWEAKSTMGNLIVLIWLNSQMFFFSGFIHYYQDEWRMMYSLKIKDWVFSKKTLFLNRAWTYKQRYCYILDL